MSYTHGDYYLYTMQIDWKGSKDGSKKTIYFFGKKDPAHQEKGIPCDIPDGMEVGTNKRTGMPYLKKIK